jgi:hypothetical protein
MKKSIVTANYLEQSVFVTDIDLNEVYKWWIKWDKLFIQFNEQDINLIEIEPNSDTCIDGDYFKYPTQFRKLVIDC